MFDAQVIETAYYAGPHEGSEGFDIGLRQALGKEPYFINVATEIQPVFCRSGGFIANRSGPGARPPGAGITGADLGQLSTAAVVHVERRD